MADLEKLNGGSGKEGRFRKSTVVGSGSDLLKRGNTDLQLPSIHVSTSTGSDLAGIERLAANQGSGGPEPVLPMFVQMNVRWDAVDTSWREASR